MDHIGRTPHRVVLRLLVEFGLLYLFSASMSYKARSTYQRCVQPSHILMRKSLVNARLFFLLMKSNLR